MILAAHLLQSRISVRIQIRLLWQRDPPIQWFIKGSFTSSLGPSVGELSGTLLVAWQGKGPWILHCSASLSMWQCSFQGSGLWLPGEDKGQGNKMVLWCKGTARVMLHHYCTHPHGQNLATWPHLVVGRLENVVLSRGPQASWLSPALDGGMDAGDQSPLVGFGAIINVRYFYSWTLISPLSLIHSLYFLFDFLVV